MAAAEHYGHKRRHRVTVPKAVAYLDANLTDLARDEDFGFAEMATDIRSCLRHVESVLNVGEHVETGAPCPVCRAMEREPRPLVREYGARCEIEGHQHSDEDPADDECDLWACPNRECQEEWTVAQYRKYVQGEYVLHADRLTADQMRAAYRVPEGTLRRWANGWTDSKGAHVDPCVRKRGKDDQGRQLYDVTDALAARDRQARERVA